MCGCEHGVPDSWGLVCVRVGKRRSHMYMWYLCCLSGRESERVGRMLELQHPAHMCGWCAGYSVRQPLRCLRLTLCYAQTPSVAMNSRNCTRICTRNREKSFLVPGFVPEMTPPSLVQGSVPDIIPFFGLVTQLLFKALYEGGVFGCGHPACL